MKSTGNGFEKARHDAEIARAEGQRIQARADRTNAKHKKPDDSEPMQAGAREYPSEFPTQHLRKHAPDSELELTPMYDAPAYRGSGKLEGMVALVTGGSSGIGRSIATLFAREGANVAIVYFANETDAEATRAAIEQEGRKALLLQGDVSESLFCKHAVEETVRVFGKLDILVNNAAFQQHMADITELTDEHFERTIKTNLHGYFYMARAAVQHLKPGGSIIMTGSVVGIRGSHELLDYSMTKGGIHAFTRSLAGQLVPRGIRVNAVAPGPVWTGLNPADRPAEDVATFGSSTPMGRAAQPEEIAPAFVFLASPCCASYITGEILPVIGGYDN